MREMIYVVQGYLENGSPITQEVTASSDTEAKAIFVLEQGVEPTSVIGPFFEADQSLDYLRHHLRQNDSQNDPQNDPQDDPQEEVNYVMRTIRQIQSDNDENKIEIYYDEDCVKINEVCVFDGVILNSIVLDIEKQVPLVIEALRQLYGDLPL